WRSCRRSYTKCRS
ncbi:Immunoglobulin A1 protease autotransporter precursor, partial [Haemophilus influenzae]